MTGSLQRKSESAWTRFPVLFLTALICCVLWGSASPAIKIAYQLFRIGPEDTASRIMLAGARFMIAGVMTGTDMAPGAIRDRIGDGESGFALAVMIAAFAAPFIMGAMNSLGSNAFSREGKHYEVLQFLPVPVRTQWNAKAAIGIVVSFLGTAPFFLFFGIYGAVPVLQLILYILIAAAASVAVTYMGMLLDSVNPKLVWEDALSALREN